MSFRISMAQPDLSVRESQLIYETLYSGQITMGPMVRRFEEAFAQRLGVKHAVAVSSGTAALHLALLAAGVRPGDRVLVPTLTYVATVAAVRYCGAIPHFSDVDPETWGMDRAAAVPANVVAAIPVHLYGVPTTDMYKLASGHIIEDAAEALGATYSGWNGAKHTAAGALGDLGVFSFYGNKILTTGEGGMVVTDDDRLAAEVRLLRGQGQAIDRRYWHTRVGYNYRMTDLQAALGVAQLERLDEMLEARHKLVHQYNLNLSDARIEVQKVRPGCTAAPWVFACLLPSQNYGPVVQDAFGKGAFRDLVMSRLAEHGIETRPTFPCVHQMPPYREFARTTLVSTDCEGVDGIDGYRDHHFPVAEDIAARGLLLPLYSQMTLDQVDEVCDRLRNLL